MLTKLAHLLTSTFYLPSSNFQLPSTPFMTSTTMLKMGEDCLCFSPINMTLSKERKASEEKARSSSVFVLPERVLERKFQSAQISVWRIPLCSSRKYDSNATDRVSIGALTNSLASVKVWSNLEKFPEILCKFLNEEDDHVSATSSTRHHPISATLSTRQRSVSNHVVATSSTRRAQSASSHRHVSDQSAPRQRPVSATTVPQSENIPSVENIPSEHIPLA
ncbi:hypothetical protein LWI28_020092 [Acer negundo]|uniref:Uncharacterized protein n=1 Tax=Acer negundo TaxID=4023 RepID=A0AAD5IND8_ACENE|nr:hypothetical protein LWI28_020092 [Acer negundo]